MTSPKQRIRREALSRRDGLDPEFRSRASAKATSRLVPFLERARSVSLYWPIRSEADPLPLIEIAARAHIEISLPFVSGGQMDFRRYDTHAPLIPGPYGTSQPPLDSEIAHPDLMIVPLAAFDRRGYRVGYGKGYFDTIIADLERSGHKFQRIGLAFGCQEVEIVPTEAHDQPLQAIATESELIVVDANL